jgi:hypothetical protein
LESTSRPGVAGTDHDAAAPLPDGIAQNAGAQPPGFSLQRERPATVRVKRVTIPEPDSDEILGLHLSRPVAGSCSDAGVIWFDGWAVGRKDPATAVEATLDGKPVWRVPVAIRSPALVDGFPGIEWAVMAAFRGAIGPVRLPRSFRLEMRIELGKERFVHLATIEGERDPLPARSPDQLQPLMITGLGRSGTTWVLQVLEQHPNVAAFRPFDYEPRFAAYWTEVLAALSEPSSYLQCLAAAPTPGSVWWLGEGAMVPRPPNASDPHAEIWLGASQLGALVDSCGERIEAFYRQVAAAQSKTDVRFFAEKFTPREWVQSVLSEIFPNAREVFLVRDFRDMVTSMLAYSRKRGVGLFGRHTSGSDEDFIRDTLRTDVESMLAKWRERSRDAYLLRYEDLILHPQDELSKLFSYLGIDSGTQIIDGILRGAAEQRPDKQDAHRTSGEVKASIGRWRTELTGSLLEACEDAFGEALEEFGYRDRPA